MGFQTVLEALLFVFVVWLFFNCIVPICYSQEKKDEIERKKAALRESKNKLREKKEELYVTSELKDTERNVHEVEEAINTLDNKS